MPTVLDYANPNRPVGLVWETPLWIRFLLLAGVAAVFTPLDPYSPLVNMRLFIERLAEDNVRYWWFSFSRICDTLLIELSIPILFLAWVPRGRPRLAKAATALAAGWALVGAASLGIMMATLCRLRTDSGGMVLFALFWGLPHVIVLLAGIVLATITWRRTRNAGKAAWVLLAALYVSAGAWFLAFMSGTGSGIAWPQLLGRGLILLNVIAIIFLGIRIVGRRKE